MVFPRGISSLTLLSFVEPPQAPLIIDPRSGKETKLVETYNEGSDVKLICQVDGGRPRPNVTWYLSDSLVDESFEQTANEQAVNRLTLFNVGRAAS